MVTSAGSVPQVHLSAGLIQLEREGGEDQGMGEGSEARGGNDCCSIVWLVRVLADSHWSWFIPALRISFDDILLCNYRVIFKTSLKYRYRIFLLIISKANSPVSFC